MRRWDINGRFLSQPTTGVQRYAREIVKALDVLVGEAHPLTRGLEMQVLCPPDSTDDLGLSHFDVRSIGPCTGHAWEQMTLPRAVRGGLVSLCNTGPVATERQIVCIHDLNTRIVPQSYSRQFRALYRMLLPALGQRCVRVATVSGFSAGEIARFGIASPERIFISPDGHEHALAWKPRHSERTRRAAGPRTIVTIGSRAPHKNLALLLGLAPRLGENGFRLAVVGAENARVFAGMAGDAAAENVHWLGRISDGELAALLQDSMCLAFPSITEGFGLPPLEAMAIGCPVVASNGGSLPEVCGGASLLADPHDPPAWLSHFLALGRREGLRAELISKGRATANSYSWRRSAEQYLEVLAALDREERSTRAAIPESAVLQ